MTNGSAQGPSNDLTDTEIEGLLVDPETREKAPHASGEATAEETNAVLAGTGDRLRPEDKLPQNPGFGSTDNERADDGLNYVRSLARSAPLYDLFCYVAYRKHSHKSLPRRVQELAKDRPKFYLLSTWGDWVIRFVAVGFMLWAASLVFLKVIA